MKKKNYLNLDNPRLRKAVKKVEKAVDYLVKGKMVIMVDDEDRENEGDLVLGAQFADQKSVNFMAKHGRGLICLALSNDIADKMRLNPMVETNTSPFQTAFTVSVEARHGVTTGISAADRATTIRTMVDENSGPEDIVKPGHVFPLRARTGGTLVRVGQTEGSVDLARIAGLKTAAVICEIMNEDGTMSRLPQLEKFSEKHNIPIVSVADIVAYRLISELLIDKIAESNLPTEFGGDFKIRIYKSNVDNREHIALIKGDIATEAPVLVRVHSECLTGDALGSQRCDCGSQLHNAMKIIEKEGRGVILYLRQEGRGIGLGNKIKAYHLQDNGFDTVEANVEIGFPPDIRDYGIGAQILYDLGISKVRLITNNPKKLKSLSGYGMEIVEQIPNVIGVTDKNINYLKTKEEKMGHDIFSHVTDMDCNIREKKKNEKKRNSG